MQCGLRRPETALPAVLCVRLRQVLQARPDRAGGPERAAGQHGPSPGDRVHHERPVRPPGQSVVIIIIIISIQG